MTKAALEVGDDEARKRAVAAIPSPTVTVPASLHASLMARLDRLGAAKRCGTDRSGDWASFPTLCWLRWLAGLQAELQSALNRLMAAGLLFRQGVPPHATYLLSSTRWCRTRLMALCCANHDGRFTPVSPTPSKPNSRILPRTSPNCWRVTARRLRLIEKAALLWGKAGQRSLARSALIEAIAQLTRALDQIVTLPATPDLRREQIKLQVALTTHSSMSKDTPLLRPGRLLSVHVF